MAVVIALGIGLAIIFATLWAVRLLATPPPPEPEPDAVVPVTATFRCTICGLQLTVTHAQDDDFEPPKHHREEMIPV